MALTLPHLTAQHERVTPPEPTPPEPRAAAPPRRRPPEAARSSTTPSYPARHRRAGRHARRAARAGQPLGVARARLPRRVRPLRALGHRPHHSGRARLRAGAQHRQAGRRTPPRAAVRALPRQARCGPAGHDDHSGGAGADRGQRAHSQQRGPLVQRADGAGARVGARHRRRLLPGAAAPRVVVLAAAGGRLGALDVAGADPASVQAALAADAPADHVELVEVFAVSEAAAGQPAVRPVARVQAGGWPPAPTRARRRWPSAPRPRAPRRARWIVSPAAAS